MPTFVADDEPTVGFESSGVTNDNVVPSEKPTVVKDEVVADDSDW